MKKIFAVIMAIFVMSFCANVSLACNCGCEKAKTAAECECSKDTCDCGCSKTTCKKVKKCMKKCMKKCAKKCGCCQKSSIDNPVKCKKELNPENKKSVSEIITDSVTPEGGDDVTISLKKCDKAPCCKAKCCCMKKCLKKCKKDLSECPKKGCPLKDVIEE